MKQGHLLTSLGRSLLQRHCSTSLTDPSYRSSPHFSGHIPPDGVKKAFSLSGGPGGQHVNKVATKAEIRFDITTADWISKDLKAHLMKKYPYRLTKTNELVIESAKTRSQTENLTDCFTKLRNLLMECAYELDYLNREPSEADVKILEKRAAENAKRRREEKRRNSDKRRDRSAVY